MKPYLISVKILILLLLYANLSHGSENHQLAPKVVRHSFSSGNKETSKQEFYNKMYDIYDKYVPKSNTDRNLFLYICKSTKLINEAQLDYLKDLFLARDKKKPIKRVKRYLNLNFNVDNSKTVQQKIKNLAELSQKLRIVKEIVNRKNAYNDMKQFYYSVMIGLHGKMYSYILQSFKRYLNIKPIKNSFTSAFVKFLISADVLQYINKEHRYFLSTYVREMYQHNIARNLFKEQGFLIRLIQEFRAKADTSDILVALDEFKGSVGNQMIKDLNDLKTILNGDYNVLHHRLNDARRKFLDLAVDHVYRSRFAESQDFSLASFIEALQSYLTNVFDAQVFFIRSFKKFCLFNNILEKKGVSNTFELYYKESKLLNLADSSFYFKTKKLAIDQLKFQQVRILKNLEDGKISDRKLFSHCLYANYLIIPHIYVSKIQQIPLMFWMRQKELNVKLKPRTVDNSISRIINAKGSTLYISRLSKFRTMIARYVSNKVDVAQDIYTGAVMGLAMEKLQVKKSTVDMTGVLENFKEKALKLVQALNLNFQNVVKLAKSVKKTTGLNIAKEFEYFIERKIDLPQNKNVTNQAILKTTYSSKNTSTINKKVFEYHKERHSPNTSGKVTTTEAIYKNMIPPSKQSSIRRNKYFEYHKERHSPNTSGKVAIINTILKAASHPSYHTLINQNKFFEHQKERYSPIVSTTKSFMQAFMKVFGNDVFSSTNDLKHIFSKTVERASLPPKAKISLTAIQKNIDGVFDRKKSNFNYNKLFEHIDEHHIVFKKKCLNTQNFNELLRNQTIVTAEIKKILFQKYVQMNTDILDPKMINELIKGLETDSKANTTITFIQDTSPYQAHSIQNFLARFRRFTCTNFSRFFSFFEKNQYYLKSLLQYDYNALHESMVFIKKKEQKYKKDLEKFLEMFMTLYNRLKNIKEASKEIEELKKKILLDPTSLQILSESSEHLSNLDQIINQISLMKYPDYLVNDFNNFKSKWDDFNRDESILFLKKVTEYFCRNNPAKIENMVTLLENPFNQKNGQSAIFNPASITSFIENSKIFINLPPLKPKTFFILQSVICDFLKRPLKLKKDMKKNINIMQKIRNKYLENIRYDVLVRGKTFDNSNNGAHNSLRNNDFKYVMEVFDERPLRIVPKSVNQAQTILQNLLNSKRKSLRRFKTFFEVLRARLPLPPSSDINASSIGTLISYHGSSGYGPQISRTNPNYIMERYSDNRQNLQQHGLLIATAFSSLFNSYVFNSSKSSVGLMEKFIDTFRPALSPMQILLYKNAIMNHMKSPNPLEDLGILTAKLAYKTSYDAKKLEYLASSLSKVNFNPEDYNNLSLKIQYKNIFSDEKTLKYLKTLLQTKTDPAMQILGDIVKLRYKTAVNFDSKFLNYEQAMLQQLDKLALNLNTPNLTKIFFKTVIKENQKILKFIKSSTKKIIKALGSSLGLSSKVRYKIHHNMKSKGLGYKKANVKKSRVDGYNMIRSSSKQKRKNIFNSKSKNLAFKNSKKLNRTKNNDLLKSSSVKKRLKTLTNSIRKDLAFNMAQLKKSTNKDYFLKGSSVKERLKTLTNSIRKDLAFNLTQLKKSNVKDDLLKDSSVKERLKTLTNSVSKDLAFNMAQLKNLTEDNYLSNSDSAKQMLKTLTNAISKDLAYNMAQLENLTENNDLSKSDSAKQMLKLVSNAISKILAFKMTQLTQSSKDGNFAYADSMKEILKPVINIAAKELKYNTALQSKMAQLINENGPGSQKILLKSISEAIVKQLNFNKSEFALSNPEAAKSLDFFSKIALKVISNQLEKTLNYRTNKLSQQLQTLGVNSSTMKTYLKTAIPAEVSTLVHSYAMFMKARDHVKIDETALTSKLMLHKYVNPIISESFLEYARSYLNKDALLFDKIGEGKFSSKQLFKVIHNHAIQNLVYNLAKKIGVSSKAIKDLSTINTSKLRLIKSGPTAAFRKKEPPKETPNDDNPITFESTVKYYMRFIGNLLRKRQSAINVLKKKIIYAGMPVDHKKQEDIVCCSCSCKSEDGCGCNDSMLSNDPHFIEHANKMINIDPVVEIHIHVKSDNTDSVMVYQNKNLTIYESKDSGYHKQNYWAANINADFMRI